jgi:predicted MFS family arabinose efflux permease
MLPLQMALCMWLIKEPAHSNSHVERQGLYTLFCQAFAYLAQHQTLKSLMISSAVGAMAYISFEKLWQLQLLELTGEGQMKWIFGVLFAASLVVGATGQLLSNQLCKIFNNNYVNAIILVRLLHAGLFLLLYLTEQLPAFVIIFVLIYFVSALSFSPVMTLFHSEIEDSKRSTMLSFRSVFIQLGAAIGVVTAALISHFVTLQAAFLTSAGIYLLSIGLLMLPSVVSLGERLSSIGAQK